MQTHFSLHLLELRLRSVYTIFSFFLAFLLGTRYSVPLTHLVCLPLSGADRVGCAFIFTHVTEGLYAAIEISFLCAFFFSIPVIVYQLYSFLLPSIYQRERKTVHWILLCAFILLLVSVSVVFLIILPKMCSFLQQFQYQSKSVQITLQARIAPAVRWSGSIYWITALLFQIPLLFGLLCRGGLPPDLLSKNRKLAWFTLLIAASLLSPPDVSSQFALAGIACFLYEFLFWFALFYNNLLPSEARVLQQSVPTL